MGVFVLKRGRNEYSPGTAVLRIILLCCLLFFGGYLERTEASSTPGIDDDAVITVEQAGSIAASKGIYGWDSRGAIFRYSSRGGEINGDLGEILFCDQSGERKCFIWDSWGMKFPDWWTKMLAERIRAEAPDGQIPAIRRAFEQSVDFECYWIIAIGIKSEKAGGKLYKTLREDNTLRVAYNVNLNKETVPEKLFRGNQMYSSLSDILKNESWGSDSQRTFAERNPYTFSVRINSYDIDLRATNCRICAERGLATGDEKCSHTSKGEYFNDRLPICYNGVSYWGGKSFAWEGQSVTYNLPEYEGYERKPKLDIVSGTNSSPAAGTVRPASDYCHIFVYNKQEDNNSPIAPGEPEPTVIPEQPGELISEDKTITETGSEDCGFSAVFASDIFNVSNAIPSTESVYAKALVNRFLIKMNSTNVSGVWPVNIVLEFPYELTWSEIDEETEEELLYSKSGSIFRTATVYRPYSYNHLNSFSYSVLESINLGNSALNPSNLILTPEMIGASMPYCSEPVVYGGTMPGEGGNIRLPTGFSSQIVLPTLYISGEGEEPEPPDISDSLVFGIAEGAVSQLECRDDEVMFDGKNLLGNSSWHTYGGNAVQIGTPKPDRLVFDTSKMWGADAIYIPADVRNGRYYSAPALVNYRTVVDYGGNTISYKSTAEVNDIFVHTPVLCRIELAECNPQKPNQYFNQEYDKTRNDSFELISGSSDSMGSIGHEEDTCDFYISVSNIGSHSIYSDTLGIDYDFGGNRSGKNGGSYVMINEIRFSFDVCVDVANDKDRANDVILTADVWHPISHRLRLYLPDYVREGDYTAEARSRAVNSNSRSDFTFVSQKYGKPYMRFNSRYEDYVAADAVKFHVSGKVFGLKLVDVNSEAEWKDVFKKEVVKCKDGTLMKNLPEGRTVENDLHKYRFYYTVGSNNELGLFTGRHERFVLPLLKGSSPNMKAQNSGILKPGYLWTYELQTCGSRMNEPGSHIDIDVNFGYVPQDKWERRSAEVFYSESINNIRHGYIKIGGEKDDENIHCKYNNNGELIANYTYKRIRIDQPVNGWGNSDNRLVWEFDYSLPEAIVVREENNVKKEGYLIINFSITAFDSRNNPVSAYQSSTGYCNMWAMEGSSLFRKDYYGKNFALDYGDVTVIDLADLKRNDYRVDHRY